MFKSMKYVSYALTAVMLLPATFVLADQSGQMKTRKEAIALTKQVERSAAKIETEAHRLSAMRTNPNISKGTHSYHLHKIAVEVNEQLQPALARLSEIQPELPEWKQEAIDQMRQSAATLAANANAAAENRKAVSVHQPAVMDPEYRQLLNNISDQAGTLLEVADATADYANAQLKGADAGLAIQSHN
jgi:hypothetical protein